MHCPRCSSERLSVVRTPAHGPMESLPRDRRCLDCDTIFETVETIRQVRVRGPHPTSRVRLVPIDEFKRMLDEGQV